MRRFLRDHGLSLTMLGLFVVLLFGGQLEAGRREYNDDRRRAGERPLGRAEYLKSPHFLQATAENWESEFLQMGIYVLGTAWLYQKGSAESKDPREKPASRQKGPIPSDAPWPVRRGGWVARVYEHSLSGAFFLLFGLAFSMHAVAGVALANEEARRLHEPVMTLGDYLGSSRFWFESFQNWQSEFLAIGSMVVLSIFLREINSPESKRMETPHGKNED